MSTRLSPEWLRGLALLALACVGTAALAADALELRTDRERQRLASERQRVEVRYAAQVQQCESQFIVTSCIEQARAERREAMEQLTQQQSAIEETLRKHRTAQALERLQEKERAAGLRRATPPQPRVVQRQASAASAASGPAGPVPGADVPAMAAPDAAPALSAAERRRNEAAFKQRQKAAAEHRAEIERRTAARAREHKPAASLPIPASAAASASR
jgi:hypothetical protein